MYIENLTLKNFRNIKDVELEFTPHINLIIAPNGTGKTNVLEAISLASTGRSPRTSFDIDLLPFEHQEKHANDFTKIDARVKDEKEAKEIIITLDPRNTEPSVKKTYKTKGKNTTRKKFAEFLNSVYFSPESIGYLTLGFQKRRDLFDSLIEATNYEYGAILAEYKKALRNRNIILKKLQTSGSKEELIYWTKIIINDGVKLIQTRWETLADYSSLLNKISKQLLSDKWISLEYKPHIESTPLDSPEEIKETFLNELKRLNGTEISAGKTLKGPHRDKWILKLDERDLSRFGSRGQQRLGILAIFLAFYEKVEAMNLHKPLILLDDVTSELDKKHISLLRDTIIEGEAQTFLTSTQEEIVDFFDIEKDKVNLIKLDEILQEKS